MHTGNAPSSLQRRPLVTLLTSLCTAVLVGCGASLPATVDTSPHIDQNTVIPADRSQSAIPPIVGSVDLVPPPTASDQPELYTVVAQDVPIRDLLFTMARDAGINVDVHPDVSGIITLNAINQTLPQILERISRQNAIRWYFDEAGNLVVEADSPYWKNYRIDYVNVSRAASTAAQVQTSLVTDVTTTTGGGGGGGAGLAGNTSNSSLTQNTANDFWATLTSNLANMLGQGADSTGPSPVLINPESGVISVRGNSVQHQQVNAFLNDIQSRSLHQVLIEATVVEVSLSDQYQSGVDWSVLGRDGGTISFEQDLISGDLAGAGASILRIDRSDTADQVAATISLLSQFGELRVLSSPKIMALNNQAAMLRVVDNTVYFTINVTPGVIAANSPGTAPVFNSVVHTVPVGFVMTVIPQVSDNDQVTLNVRPTISRIVRYVPDPGTALADIAVTNAIPEIQVREMESVLKVYSGQVAILGGLMQDTLRNDVNGLPVLSRLPGVRNLFSARNEQATKTELIVFIRPVVIRQPSLNGDLQDYRNYLPANGLEQESAALEGVLPQSNR